LPPPMNLGKIDLLLVEDDPNDLELSLRALRKRQLADKIHVARDGEEALDFLFCRGDYAARQFEEPPRVVILDLKLPKINGLEVLSYLKADPRTRLVPVVVLTSSHEPRDMLRVYELGANSFIQKPIDYEDFQTLIGELGHYWIFVNQCVAPNSFVSVKDT
jgi:two-component system response regulator